MINISDINVAVVGIAKDEAGYIHEWVHHYLYMGFTQIYIAVNRTTDDTIEVLRKIRENYPQVYFFEVDWMDQGVLAEKNSQIQPLSYAYLSNRITNQHKDTSHILYVDIDEFWFPNGFDQNINQYISGIPKFDTLSFSWFCQNGDESSFQAPFENLNITPSDRMKSLVNVASFSKLNMFRCHAPRFNNKEVFVHLDSNGNKVDYGKHDQIFSQPPATSSKAFVLHRMIRSEVEYTAMLLRQRPGVSLPIKDNRNGYTREHKTQLKIEQKKLLNYHRSLEEFSDKTQVSSIVNNTRRNLIARSERILETPATTIAQHVLIYLRALEGTKHQKRVLEILLDSEEGIILDKFAKPFFDCCSFFENKGDLSPALQYLELAQKCRPNGIIIKQRLDKLKKRVEQTNDQPS